MLTRWLENALDSCTDTDSIEDTLGDITRLLGCDYFMYVSIIRAQGSTESITTTLKGYPNSWWQHYIQHGYRDQDAVTQRIINGTRPFIWSELTDLTPIQQRIFTEAAEHGIVHGISCPLHTPTGSAGLTFASRKEHPGLHDLKPMVLYIATLVHDNVIRILNEGSRALSKRQRQVMELYALGMSRREIAETLNIAESTVKTHLDAIYQKINVHSKAEAISKARALGWLPVI